jgi:SpoVK/Ycf46/Vps4 family AAA+-type ATPase
MESFQSYLLTDYRENKEKIERAEAFISEVIQVFVNFFIDKGEDGGLWPYEVVDYRVDKNQRTASDPEEHYSESTNAMIIFTLASLSGKIQKSPLLPDVPLPFVFGTKDVYGILQKALVYLVKHKPRFDDVITWSSTFGANDPFTLSWLLELINALHPMLKENLKESEINDLRNKLLDEAKVLIKKAVGNPSKPLLDWKGKVKLAYAPEHMFPLLRTVQLLLVLERFKEQPERTIEPIHRYFMDCLHRHLSYSSIPDSGFDAAELVFSLEGSLLCNPEAQNELIIRRVFQILPERQEQSPYWRSTKPFVSTPTGQVLMPLSVEIANSLLRICVGLETNDFRDTYVSTNVGLFNRYADWLRSRLIRGIAERTSGGTQRWSFMGWVSEHMPTPGTIHLWETSQVLLFLAYYAAMLQKHVARNLLQRGNLSVKILKAQSKSWEAVEQKFEPLIEFDDRSQYRVFRRIGENYIMPRSFHEIRHRVGQEIHYSMLLYGPPGTVKTTIALEVSKMLGYPLIQITPSDFIAGGEAEVETRAKAIFKALEEQREVLILFDEIDHMMLDRDSNLYRDQSDVFQFLTPGMLTKLKDLRDKKRSIFIIATNYAERIDRAIKRHGRIDDRYLVLPPDAAQRRKILKQQIEDYSKRALVSPDDLGSAFEEVIKNTSLFTFHELDQLVITALSVTDLTDNSKWISRLVENLKKEAYKFEPAINLLSYRGRFEATAEKPEGKFPTIQEPFEEFLLLVYLALEGKDDLSPEERDTVKLITVGRISRPVSKQNIVRTVLVHVRDDEVKKELLGKFKSWEWCE